MSIGPVLVQTHPIGKQAPEPGRKRLLVHAELSLESFPVTDESGFVVIPDEPRMQCEAAIEVAASLVSIMCMCKRSISSPMPWVAFAPDTEEELRRLQETNGILHDPVTREGASFAISPDPLILDGIADRFDGVTLLAESFAHENELGRYREFMRFFELAFALPVTQVGKKLSQFLTGAGLGYSRAEVESWLELRHGATHGDGKRAKRLVIEADVRPLIQRIKQAAFDVLFNKLDWGKASRSRRDLWRPTASTHAPTGKLCILQGSTVGFEFHLLDAFGVYPFDLSACLDELPDTWWCKKASKRPVLGHEATSGGSAGSVENHSE
jgi:hypothetical protein